MERTKQHLLQKLYSREIHGSFIRGQKSTHNKAAKLFESIPKRLMFPLKDVLQHMGNHILVGTTRCGQFLITYSYATELRLPVQVYYKYRLHWWAFRPGKPAYKVAEVQLFDNQEVTYALTVGIAQWPNVNDKLIAYGFSDDAEDAQYEQEEVDTESCRYYITVTTLPSLHNCKDCKAVAESFDEEDMAANWDSCIGLSCLRHSLTIHTTIDLTPPFPPLNFHTSLKVDNKIIVNTGNFLHVLSFNSDKQEIKTSRDDNIVPDNVHHKIGELLSDKEEDYICPWKAKNAGSESGSRRSLARSVNKAWLNKIMDRAEKVYAFSESDDGCEPRFKWFKRKRIADKMYEFCDEEELENVYPLPKVPRSLSSSNDLDFEYPPPKGEGLREISHRENDYSSLSLVETIRVRQAENIRRNEQLEERYSSSNNSEKYLVESLKVKQMSLDCKRRREGGTMVPSRKSCDSEISNECDTQLNKRLDESMSDDSHNSTCDSPRSISCDVSCKENCDIKSNLVVGEMNGNPSSSTSNVESLPSKSKPLNVSIINPDLSAILAEWEADSVSSLSPNSDCLLYKNESKNEAIQSFLELIPGVTISPQGTNSTGRATEQLSPDSECSGSPRLTEASHSVSRVSSPNCKYSPLLVVLRARNSNCSQENEHQKLKEHEDKGKQFTKEEVSIKVKVLKDSDTVMRQRMISGCSVQFDRLYIEVDEEVISTITDVEDDDQGTGFHCALPLSVHGSAYAQLQMVSSQKAEKLNINCERVYQTSLDIDQFCFKAADTICINEGFKFWFFNDYDVEIIDVCAMSGDILGVVCLRINAEKKLPKNDRSNTVSQRLFYDVRCVFVWNPSKDQCWLEAYSRFEEKSKCIYPNPTPARKEATKLRKLLKKSSMFSLKPHPPIRTFEHRMWTEDNLVPSLEEIRDNSNLIGFRLMHFPRR